MLKKKLIAMIMSIICVLGCFTDVQAANITIGTKDEINLKATGTGTQLLTWKGIIDADNFAPSMVMYTADDGKQYPAYCIQPDKAGVDNMASKAYDVKLEEYIPRLCAALMPDPVSLLVQSILFMKMF